MPHILVICTANICRSPVAEVMIRQRLRERDLTPETGWTVTSAGTWALESRPPARYSQQLMAERGLDISDKRAQMVTEEMIAEADLVVCMEAGHVEALRTEFSRYRDKIYLLSELAGRHYSVNDPYGQSIVEYQAMVTELENLLDGGTEQLVEWSRRHAGEG